MVHLIRNLKGELNASQFDLHFQDKRADQVIVFVWIMSVTVSALTVHSVDEDNQLKLRSRLFQNQSDNTVLRWECVASFSPFYAIW